MVEFDKNLKLENFRNAPDGANGANSEIVALIADQASAIETELASEVLWETKDVRDLIWTGQNAPAQWVTTIAKNVTKSAIWRPLENNARAALAMVRYLGCLQKLQLAAW